jgi:hypothetical protein
MTGNIALQVAIACTVFITSSAAPADPSHKLSTKLYIYPMIMGEVLRPTEPPGIEMTDRGRNIRGVYIPIGRLMSWTPKQLVKWVERVGADAVILDIKDDKGRVTFTRQLPNANKPPHGIVPRMKTFVEHLKSNNIYAIGRLVCFKDNLFIRRHPDTAIVDKRTGEPWRDRTNLTWLDPFSLAAHEYIASIAVAAEALGFDEIQLDYVRFPVDGSARYARYPNREKDMARFEAIAALLARVDRMIHLPLSIDVFGLTALRPGDREGIGQSLEHLAPYLDAISPMLYLANWPKRHWENPTPQKTHALVHNAIVRIRNRLGDTVAVRPLLQGFKYRAANFGVDFIYNQIDAAETAGSSGHLFWNQAGYYTKVALAWRRRQLAGASARQDSVPGEIATPGTANRLEEEFVREIAPEEDMPGAEASPPPTDSPAPQGE